MEANSFSLFKVDFARIRESLLIVANDIEFIVGASDDDLTGYEVWEARERAGRHVFRLRQLLNHGSLELADCSEDEIASLSNIWLYLKFLRFGEHCDDPAAYRGPLFLPDELDSAGKLRTSDQQYSKYGRLTEGLDLPQVERSLNEARQQLNPNAKPIAIDWMTCKREDWGDYPDDLRSVSSWIKGDSVQHSPTITEGLIPTADGPISDGRWQYQGQILIGRMPPQVHKLASHLFKSLDQRDVPFSELVSNGIFKDEYVDDQTIAKHGRLVTKWFRDRKVPLKVSSTTVDRTMALCTLADSQDGT